MVAAEMISAGPVRLRFNTGFTVAPIVNLGLALGDAQQLVLHWEAPAMRGSLSTTGLILGALPAGGG